MFDALLRMQLGPIIERLADAEKLTDADREQVTEAARLALDIFLAQAQASPGRDGGDPGTATDPTT